MASRDSEFAAFVDDRGPALWRTASLLELDADMASDALTAALASAARHWRTLSRDGEAELEVRRSLFRSTSDSFRRASSLNDVPPTESLADETRERQALGALSNADRALIVFTTYESLSPDEAAALLRLHVDDPQVALGSASARLRQMAGLAPDAPLLPLLNASALRDVPDDLATRAAAVARHGTRRALLVASGAVLALVAAAAGASALLRESPEDVTASQAESVARWGIPSELPTSRGLPSLAEAPIEAASMALSVAGTPIVVDATTGAARTVFASEPQPAWYDGDVDGVITGTLRRGPPFTQAVLSPDGQWVLVVSQRATSETGDTYLVQVATGDVLPLRGVRVSGATTGRAGLANTVLAWSPGGGAFACVCGGRLAVYDLEPVAPRVILANRWSIPVTDVAWGGSGLAARTTRGTWLSVSSGGVPIPALGDVDALATSLVGPPRYLAVSVTSIYALGADTEPDGGRCVWWDGDFSDPVEVTPVPDRDGDLCTPVALQPGRSGVLLVLRPDRPRPQPLPLDVVSVDVAGTSTVIATLPPGTTTASFAAELVG